jgi:predicted kinase
MTQMKQAILTVGISGSGKTTWANTFVRERAVAGEIWFNLNRDDIRAEVYKLKTGRLDFTWANWKHKWEKDAIKFWLQGLDAIIERDIYNGIILSDTNLNPNTRNSLIARFQEAGCEVDLKIFDVNFETACARDLQRYNPVGAKVIGDQIQKFWRQFGQPYTPNSKLAKAVIVDIDGTLAHKCDRDIYDYTKVLGDHADPLVTEVVKSLRSRGVCVVILSGRESVCRDVTWAWLTSNLEFEPDDLFMRDVGDHRRDSVVKRELFDEHIRNKYNVIGVIDDRPQVITECWLPLGIRTMAVGNPYHFF